MKSTLLFYEKDDYYDFVESKKADGYTIISITKFIHNTSLISNFDYLKEIIDISALSEYNSIQSIFEQVYYQFSDEPIFICDASKKEKLEFELRLTFETFENVDKESFTQTGKRINVIEANQVIAKRHKKIIDLSEDELDKFFQKFSKRLYGHSKFKKDFENQIMTFRVFNKIKEHKILSLFLMGESGVGKTEVARSIFECLDGAKKLAKINFGNYSNEFSLSSLIGSARGYTGSEDGEIFMKVRETDIGVLLIDEFEKANFTLFNYFLEVLESGKMTSSLGEEMDLNGFIIVFTSNIMKDDFKKIISPELRSRFDYKCVFSILSDEDKEKYIEFRANSISKKIKNEYNMEIAEQLKEFLVNSINVSVYSNMRDINKQIKREFLRYLSIYHSSQVTENETENKLGFTRKILAIFNK